MSLDNPDVVDLITESPTGEFALIMSDTGPWDGSAERIHELQTKLNTYCAFVESGALYEQYPQARDRPLRFQLDTIDPLDPVTQRFFDEAVRTLADDGIRLVVEQYDPELVKRFTEARGGGRLRRWRRRGA